MDKYCNAEKYCADHGGRLVAKDFSTAWQFFEMKGLDATRLWIGVTDLLNERNRNRTGWQFSWGSDSGTLATDSQFIENNWNVGQPSNYKEDCTVYNNYGKINDISCHYVYNFVCEFDSRYAETAVNKVQARTSDDQSVCTNIINSTQSVSLCTAKFVFSISFCS